MHRRGVPGGEKTQIDSLVRKFTYLTILNGFLLLVFTLPILDPSLCIATPPGLYGCKASMDVNWPGTWLLFAWLIFLGAGVVGTLAWASLFNFGSTALGKKEANSALSWLTLAIYEIGVVGATTMMAVIGYVGGTVLATGGSAVVASTKIADDIIPALSSDPTSPLSDMPPVVEAIFIGIACLGVLLGLITFLRAKKGAPATG